MSSNMKLAIAVEEELNAALGSKVPTDFSGNPIFDARGIERVIESHQSQYPGSWQNWTHAGMLRVITKLIRKAIRAKETVPERIVSL